MQQKKVFAGFAVLTLATGPTACGGGGGCSNGATPMSTVNIAVTDAPSNNFNHAWITIKEVRFHTSDAVHAGDPSTGLPTCVPAGRAA